MTNKISAYHSRNAYILERVRGKTVLHLGCVGGSDHDTGVRVQAAETTLHYLVTQAAREVVGVDLARDVIDRYREEGMFDNIVYGDVEELGELKLDRTFDVILAGDIIEHLSNPGRSLIGMRRFASAETDLILTTPNAFGLPAILRYAVNRFREGGEHVLSFNAQNLTQLLSRHGWSMEEMFTCYQERAKQQTFFSFGRWVLGRSPKFGGTLGVRARLARTE